MIKNIGISLILALAAAVPFTAISASNGTQWSLNQQDAPKLTVAQGNLTITAQPDCQPTFEIYSITGQLVKRIRLNDGYASIDLHSGCYIVRYGKWSKKIVVS